MKKYLVVIGILAGLLISSSARGDDGVQAEEQLGLTAEPATDDVPLISGDFVSPDPEPERKPDTWGEVWDKVTNYRYGSAGVYGNGDYSDLECAFLGWAEGSTPPSCMVIGTTDEERALDAENANHEEVPVVGDLGGPVEEHM